MVELGGGAESSRGERNRETVPVKEHRDSWATEKKVGGLLRQRDLELEHSRGAGLTRCGTPLVRGTMARELPIQPWPI